MKKLNKILSIGLAAMMAVAAMSMSAFAEEYKEVYNANAIVVQENASDNDKYYAYMDYDSADETTKVLILKARKNIAFGDFAWTVDGQMTRTDENGNEVALPEFSDLFPEWDLSGLTFDEVSNISMARAFTINCNKAVNVPAQSSAQSDCFYSFTANGKKVYAWAATLQLDYQINFGFKNVNNGDYIGYYPGCDKKQAASISTEDGVPYEVRCSSKQGNCEARLRVSETCPSDVEIL